MIANKKWRDLSSLYSKINCKGQKKFYVCLLSTVLSERLIAEKMLKDKKGSNVLFGRRRNATKS